MPAWDDSRQGLGKGGRTPHRGRRLKGEQVPGQRKVTPLRPPSPVTDLHHRRAKRKRSHDRLADGIASKKSRRDGQFRTGLDADIVDLTATNGPLNSSDRPQRSGKGSTGIIRDTTSVDLTDDPSVNSLDTSPHEAGRAPRLVKPLIPSTPTREPKEKPEVIVLSDSDDESEKTSTAPPRTPVRKTPQSGTTESAFGLVTPGTPNTPRLIAQPRGRLVSNHGQVRPANSAAGKGAMSLTPAPVRMRPMCEMAFHPGGLAAGSPGASKDLESPFKPSPAQDATNEMVFAKTSLPSFRERESGQSQDQLWRGSKSVSRVVVRDRYTGPRKTDGETKIGDNKDARDGRIGIGAFNKIESDSSSDEAEDLPKSDRLEKQQIFPKSTPGAPISLLRTPSKRRGGFTGIVVLRLPPHKLLRFPQRRVQNPELPIGTKCFLLEMSAEMQNNVFKYLLLAADPIQLLHQWSQLYRGKCSGLHPAILSTCKRMFKNSSAFLYGENTFRYLIRDKFQSGALPSVRQDIYVDKYMPLFRKLELQIERSRTENAYCTSMANAIDLLNENVADLQTLVIDVSPSVEGDTLSAVGYFYRNGQIMRALKALSSRFITLRVFTPAASLRRVYNMRTERGVLDRDPMMPPQDKLDEICEMICRAYESPSEVVEQGLFEKFKVVPRQDVRPAGRPSTATYSFSHDDDDDDIDSDDGDDGDDRDSDFEG